MRLAFVFVCLVGANCGDGDAPGEHPLVPAETVPPDADATDLVLDPPGWSDAPENDIEPETGDGQIQSKEDQDRDTGRVEQIEQRVDRNLQEADNVIHMLQKDAHNN